MHTWFLLCFNLTEIEVMRNNIILPKPPCLVNFRRIVSNDVTQYTFYFEASSTSTPGELMFKGLLIRLSGLNFSHNPDGILPYGDESKT